MIIGFCLVVIGFQDFVEKDELESKIWQDEINARLTEVENKNKHNNG